MLNIKAIVATYFAKIDTQISENNKRVKNVQEEFDRF